MLCSSPSTPTFASGVRTCQVTPSTPVSTMGEPMSSRKKPFGSTSIDLGTLKTRKALATTTMQSSPGIRGSCREEAEPEELLNPPNHTIASTVVQGDGVDGITVDDDKVVVGSIDATTANLPRWMVQLDAQPDILQSRSHKERTGPRLRIG